MGVRFPPMAYRLENTECVWYHFEHSLHFGKDLKWVRGYTQVQSISAWYPSEHHTHQYNMSYN
jgi:hypothetical protein